MEPTSRFYPSKVEMTLEEFNEIMEWALGNAHFSFIKGMFQAGTPKPFRELSRSQRLHLVEGMPDKMRGWILRRGYEEWLRVE